MKRNRSFALAAGVLAILGGPAAAEGYLNGFLCGEMPEPLSVEVDVLDDSEQMLKLREGLLSALATRRTEVSAAAPLILMFDAEAAQQNVLTSRPELYEYRESTEDHEQARTNLWSNRRDSVLGGRKHTILREGGNEIRLSITVNDKSNGRCLWRGEAVYDASGHDPWEVASKLVPVIVNAIGETVAHRSLEID